MSGPGTQRPSRPVDLTLILRIAIAFTVALGAWYLLRGAWSRAVMAAADPVLRASEGVDTPVLRIEDGTGWLVTRLRSAPDAPLHRLHLDAEQRYDGLWNLILHFGLLGLLPLACWRRRWSWVLGVTAVLFASHVAWFAAAMVLRLEGFYTVAGHAQRSEGLLEVIAGAAHLYQTILGPLLPFALVAPIGMVPLGRRRPARGEATGRNAPCPCGSGRKFKRCCGA